MLNHSLIHSSVLLALLISLFALHCSRSLRPPLRSLACSLGYTRSITHKKVFDIWCPVLRRFRTIVRCAHVRDNALICGQAFFRYRVTDRLGSNFSLSLAPVSILSLLSLSLSSKGDRVPIAWERTASTGFVRVRGHVKNRELVLGRY